MITLVVAALWGWCEATWFFVIPDVALSFMALVSLRTALKAMLAAVVGAMLGAVTVYWAQDQGWDPVWLWSWTPGFRHSMMAQAGSQLQAGAWALSLGPADGIPYKVYILMASRQGIPLLQMLLWTPPARMERMIVPILVAAGIRAASRRLGPELSAAWVHILVWSLLWILIYVFYWLVFVPGHFGP